MRWTVCIMKSRVQCNLYEFRPSENKLQTIKANLRKTRKKSLMNNIAMLFPLVHVVWLDGTFVRKQTMLQSRLGPFRAEQNRLRDFSFLFWHENKNKWFRPRSGTFIWLRSRNLLASLFIARAPMKKTFDQAYIFFKEHVLLKDASGHYNV
jgi:hypothetical protein